MSLDFSLFPRLEIGGKRVKQIVRKSDGQVLWTAGYINMVPLSIDSSGAIYNGTGYKEGYRIRSGGAEAESADAVCTGFIPYKQGDILRIYPAFIGRNTENTINFADASFTNLGQRTDSGATYGICSTNANLWTACETAVDGVSVVDISDIPNAGDVAYVRITNCYGTLGDGTQSAINSGAELIVTVNEEIN